MSDTIDRVIADTLRFKQKLQIGEDAYVLLRAKKTLFSLWDAGGAGWTGVGVAKSSWVATSFFAPAASTGVLGWLGLAAPAAAVTPVGWVVVAGLIAGGGYYGVTRWLAGGPDKFVDTIPKFINTPIDLLGAGLFDLTAPLAMQVARSDGFVHEAERETILRHFVDDWGFDPVYASAGLRLVEAESNTGRITALAKALAEFQRASPDCNPVAMQRELMLFLRELIEADGVIAPRELRVLSAIESAFKAESALVSRTTARRAKSVIKDVRASIENTATKAGASLTQVTRASTSALDDAALAFREKAGEALHRPTVFTGRCQPTAPPKDTSSDG